MKVNFWHKTLHYPNINILDKTITFVLEKQLFLGKTKGLPGLQVGRRDFVLTAWIAERCAPGRTEPSPL